MHIFIGTGIPWRYAVLLSGRGSESGDEVHTRGLHRNHTRRDQYLDREVSSRHSYAFCSGIRFI